MDWSSILYAGLGGAFGAGMGSLFVHFTKKKEIGVGITAALVVLFSFIAKELYQNETFPRIVPMDVSALEKESPGLESLRVNHPEKFKEAMSFFDGPSRRNNITESDTAAFRDFLTFTIEDFKTRSPARLSRESLLLAVTLFEILEEKKPGVCTSLIQGTHYPSLGPIVGPEFINRENNIMKELFSLKKSEMLVPVQASLGEELYITTFANAMQSLDIQAESIGVSTTDVENCQLIAELSRDGASLNDEDIRLFIAYQKSLL